MVPDDSSSDSDARTDASDARNRRETDDGAAVDRGGPNTGSDGFLSR